ncbi:pyridine nucleotide-disulfide oxidoreductase [Streptomyces griseus]|uniref:FAD/NAD(P)-binding protein n=1 Tax=Streptomyces globisporus TaxID=1908 RepID=UPI0005C7FF6E|nr:FAD/NAD(P)-binding protein [Streptomyces globisporus]AWL90795.1 pyridine nucleotide-disulfide oxidoreductase [Streptomyces globisporus]PPA38183.1 pyridine nucleotide-disulfide oxidoreductase [Streptomyces griseus]RAN13440.1 pyridine nucleotide-disulfide oxidoreductase [Streptomyces badius]RAN22128.1 pyridine nucleotide-disulfide oxidoreductase [Streptomyces badius]
MGMTGVRPRVLVVGAGLAGTATAIRLLHFARRPLEVVLLERRAAYRSAGVAYHRDGNPWDHVFNIQAGRMSVFREDVLDFINWANQEADRRDWPRRWASWKFTEQGPAPRRIFQDYLDTRLVEAARESCPGVVLVEADGEALDARPHDRCFEVTVRGLTPYLTEGLRPGPLPDTQILDADHVVLATGLELKEPPFAAGVAGHPSFVRNPYSAPGIRKLAQLPPDASVAIVGSVLSAYDSAGLLLRNGHVGRIHLISRSGTIFRTYPGTHEHGVLQLPRPDTLMQPYRDREEFLARVRTAWQAACAIVRDQHPEIDPVIISERVAKAWEPYIPEVIDRIPSEDLRRLLDEFATGLAALRVGAVEYTMAIIERAMRPQDGRVELVVGRVQEISPAESGRLTVSVVAQHERHSLEADLVVSNFGREFDYAKVEQPLWRNLLRKGVAVPHERTGRGVEVDECGTLLGSDGTPAGPISTVGVPREGDEIVRHGRTGAFAFNLAAIKNHSVSVAAHVVEELELRQDGFDDLAARHPHYRSYVSNPEEAVRDALEQSVVLEVRRLASRQRRNREALESRLNARIRSMGSLPVLPAGVPRDDRLIRAVVNRVAVERLNDVSVTPRQLRRQLGLENAEHPEE